MTIWDGLAWAGTQLGKPYDSSATGRFGPTGYDCSGFVSQILWHAGMPQGVFPTNSADMTRYLVAHPELRLSRAQARVTPGAIVLLGGINGYGPLGHVGLVASPGRTFESRGRTGTGNYNIDDIRWDDFMLAPAVEYARPTPPPLPIPIGDDMPYLMRGDKTPEVWLVNGNTRLWLDQASYGPWKLWLVAHQPGATDPKTNSEWVVPQAMVDRLVRIGQ
jgi:hypothetical protein